MIILIHSETAAATIAANLGASEYSYYFVLKEFRPLLETFGLVIPVTDPAFEVDRIVANATAQGERCVFLTFSPPHRSFIAAACPTIPVFAWEFDSLPDETWDDDPRHDWRTVLAAAGQAITHSQFAVATVRAAMGPDFPIVSIPAPVWDRFAPLFDPAHPTGRPLDRPVTLTLRGRIYDTNAIDLAAHTPTARRLGPPKLPPGAGARDALNRLTLSGVIYTSIFCPVDGRKNWLDMIGGFIFALRHAPDATLVLKLTHRDADDAILDIIAELAKHTKYHCRIVIIDGYLDDNSYLELAAASTYAVNSSRGEGQCLPLMEYMSAGKPAVAPRHSAMLDYLTDDNGFIIATSLESGSWPHDPRHAFRTRQHRIDVESLMRAYRASYDAATTDPTRYAAMAAAAHAAQRAHCAREVALQRLARIIR